MNHKTVGYALSSLALIFTAISGQAEAKGFGSGFRSSPFRPSYRSSPYRSSPYRSSPSRSNSTSSHPSEETSSSSGSTSSSNSATTTSRRFQQQQQASISANRSSPLHTESMAARRFSKSGVPLTNYRKAQTSAAGGGMLPPVKGGRGHGGGGEDGGNNGSGNNGRKSSGFNNYAHYQHSNSSNFLRNYIIFSALTHHPAHTASPVATSVRSSENQTGMECAIDRLKATTEFSNASRSKLVKLIKADTPKIHAIIEPCLPL